MQKRVGTALRKLKRENPGLGGRVMRKAIHASFMHWASSESRLLHDHCPTSSTSWCRYQRDVANGTIFCIHGPGLPLPVIAKVKPEYVRLSEDSLLEKCLHGKTQNQDQTLNGMASHPYGSIYQWWNSWDGSLWCCCILRYWYFCCLKLFDALGIPLRNLRKLSAGNKIRRLFTWHRERAKAT